MTFDFGFPSKNHKNQNVIFVVCSESAGSIRSVSPFFQLCENVGSSALHLSSDGVDALSCQRPNIFGHLFDGDVTNAFEIENVLQVSLDVLL